jgi:hypothetical protein
MEKGVMRGIVVAALFSAALIGCGDITRPIIVRQQFDASGDASDLGAGDASDAGALGLQPFGVATLITPLLNPNATEDPTFTGDERELYFMSSRATGNQDIWGSQRLAKTDP